MRFDSKGESLSLYLTDSMISTRKYIAIILMCSCLVLLTGINLLIYPNVSIAVEMDESVGEDKSFPVPIEEKSETSSSASVIEEFLHNSHNLDLSWFERLSIQKIHNAEKLQIVHYDLWSPPPKFS